MSIELATGHCAMCGKVIPRMSTRDLTPKYCSRVCASQARYRTRYIGSNSGPADRPTQESTLKIS